MDNKTAIIDRKVWNFIEDASEQACAEYVEFRLAVEELQEAA